MYKCAWLLSPGLMRINIETTEGWIFQRVYLYVWVIAEHELSILSIRVHNSLTVHDSLWALKFDIFSEFQNYPFPLSLNNCFKGIFFFVIDYSGVIVKPSIKKLPITRQCMYLRQRLCMRFLVHSFHKTFWQALSKCWWDLRLFPGTSFLKKQSTRYVLQKRCS